MSEEQELNEVPQTAEDAEALLNDISAPDAEKSASMPDKAPSVQEVREYELMIAGKPIKAKEDQVLKWATMGYDAPNKIGELNKQLDTWKQKETQFKEWESKYGEVDQYVRQNPQWFQFIQQQYTQAQEQARAANPLLNEFQSIKQEVESLKQYKDAIVTQQEDRAYITELDTIKKAYPKIDLTTPDETGKSLEYKILEHAQKEGIKKFSTAFKDYMHEELMKSNAETAKESLIKDKQARSKLGILNISDKPTTKREIYSKDKSYNQLTADIIKELNLT